MLWVIIIGVIALGGFLLLKKPAKAQLAIVQEELDIIVEEEVGKVSEEQAIIQEQEEELGRPLTEAECEALGETSEVRAEKYIRPSGLITSADNEFWAGTTSTVEERRAEAQRISALIGVDVSWAECALVARELRKAEDLAEAISRGIKIEEIDPETGEVIGTYAWQMTLRHERSLEKVASMPYEEYKAATTYPAWYTERDREMGYASQLTEAIERGIAPMSSFTEAVESGEFTQSMLMEAYQAGRIPESFLHIGMGEEVPPVITPTVPTPVAAPAYIPQTQVTTAVSTAKQTAGVKGFR